ncbi:MAG: hypothetical protein JWM10_140 [Myxococcaceae bacterium]|nr:hypothetical protein [Myxococcaceae bacterium]
MLPEGLYDDNSELHDLNQPLLADALQRWEAVVGSIREWEGSRGVWRYGYRPRPPGTLSERTAVVWTPHSLARSRLPITLRLAHSSPMPALLPIFLFAAVLLFVAALRIQHATRVFLWVAATPDRTLRPLLGASCVSGVVAATALVARGLPPPAAFAAGAILTLGVLVAAAGVLGIEGSLVESGSEAAERVALGQPPKSSTPGRVIAILIGAALTGGASALWFPIACRSASQRPTSRFTSLRRSRTRSGGSSSPP